MSIFVIGIDPGLNNLGISVIEYSDLGGTSNFYLKYFEEINTSSKEPIEERLYIIYLKVIDILEKFPMITIMGLEESFVNINNKTSLKIAMVNGVLVVLSKKFNLKLKYMSSTYIKKKISGLGHASKEQIKFFVDSIIYKDTFFINCENKISHHVYDSIAIAIVAV